MPFLVDAELFYIVGAEQGDSTSWDLRLEDYLNSFFPLCHI